MNTQALTTPTQLQQAQPVAKEWLKLFKFQQEDVLTSKEEKNRRQHDLLQATLLGNAFHNKVKIYFEDKGGLKCVETTVWGITDDKVILKQNITLPINRIHKVLY